MAPTVFVVLAVFRPDPAHLAAQIASITGQSGVALRLIAVIADTHSEDLMTQTAQEAGIAVHLVPSDVELDAVRAFEAGLAEVLRLIDAEGLDDDTCLIALSDQDDIWHPDRLARGVAVLQSSKAQMVHSDARLVAGDGTTQLQPSMFRFERRHRNPGLRGLLYRNNITGMTLLARARVARIAVPFPAQSGVHYYHDLWLGLIAAATGGVALIKAPLVDYRQHGANAIGAVDRQAGYLRNGKNTGRCLPDAMWVRREAAGYALARFLAHSAQNRMVEAVDDGRLPPDQARTAPLRPFLRRMRGWGSHLGDCIKLALTGHMTLARIAFGFMVVSAGRNVWTLREALGPGLNAAIDAFDTRLYSMSPGVRPRPPQIATREKIKPHNHEGQIDIRKVRRWEPGFDAPGPALTILVPTLNPSEIFAGINTALDIGLGLAARGHHVRFIATDLPISSPGTSRAFLLHRLSKAGAESGAQGRVSLHCGVKDGTVPAHKDDLFLATAWWSAHLADGLIRDFGYTQTRFWYLIQDFEPNFYAWGVEYADAMASYHFDFEPVFNTALLRDYFAERGFDFATPDALAFHPSINVERYASGARPDRTGPRRLALYGRPEVPRNMYGTAVEALAMFVREHNLGPDDIELVSVGLPHAPLKMPNGLLLDSQGKLPMEDYPPFLLNTDLGLSLMYSPHPSHPPIEMAASGVRVVTNSFGPKDLSRLSPAILSAPPTAPDIAAALSQAWTAAPVTAQERQIDLTELGLPPEVMIDRLARRLTRRLDPQGAGQRRILLHIGSPKCGSTYLQRVMQQNRDTLEGAGIRYPYDGDDHPGNAPDLSVFDAARLEALFAGDIHTVMLSHEDLYSKARTGLELSKAAQAAGIDVQVVAFLRPFSDFFYSDYSQFMKQHFESFLETRKPYGGKDFHAFATRRTESLRPAVFLTNWQKLFPATPVVLAPHSQIRPVMTGLLQRPGTPLPDLNWTVPHHHANPSLRVEDCDRIAAAMQDPAIPPEQIREMFRAAFHHAGDTDSGRTETRTARIERHYAPQNQALLETFGYDNRLPEQVACTV